MRELPAAPDEVTMLQRERDALLDSAAEGIYGVDLRGCCTFVNRSAAEMLGYTQDEMVGRNMHALVHAKYPDGRPFPAEDCRIVQAFSSPEKEAKHLRNLQLTLWRKDGSPVCVEHNAEAVVLDGEVRGTVVTLRDVTERNAQQAERQAMLEQEQALRQRAELLNDALKSKEQALREALGKRVQLMEAIPQMVWVVGPAGGVDYLNQRWRRFTGADEELIGRMRRDALASLELIHPDDRGASHAAFTEALSTRQPFEREHRMRQKDGAYRWVLARAHPLIDETGKVTSWFGTSTDIHDRKMGEELLRRTEKLAAAGRLAATVAHEINNPLEAVGNLLYLAMHEPELPPSARGYLQTASEELLRVSRIVSQTLGFYRESNAVQPVDVSALVDDVLVLYQRRLDARQIRVTRRMEEGVMVQGIAGELRQVVANLLSNALDAMEPYGVLGVEVRQQQDGARITVSDTGHGIPPALMENIFEPFFTTKKDAGTGLGLWVSRGIVEKHQGRLDVASSREQSDHGTVFVMTLPQDAELEQAG